MSMISQLGYTCTIYCTTCRQLGGIHGSSAIMMYSIGLVGVLHQLALGFYIHSVLVILMSEPAVTYIAKHICCYFNGRSVIYVVADVRPRKMSEPPCILAHQEVPADTQLCLFILQFFFGHEAVDHITVKCSMLVILRTEPGYPCGIPNAVAGPQLS